MPRSLDQDIGQTTSVTGRQGTTPSPRYPILPLVCSGIRVYPTCLLGISYMSYESTHCPFVFSFDRLHCVCYFCKIKWIKGDDKERWLIQRLLYACSSMSFKTDHHDFISTNQYKIQYRFLPYMHRLVTLSF